MEQGAEDYFKKIDDLGGVIPAIEKSFFQSEIARSAYQYQREIEEKERIIVGINDFIEEDEKIEIPILAIKKEVEEKQIKRLNELKQSRDNQKVAQALNQLSDAAGQGNNLMPEFINCAKMYATIGEMINVLKERYGEYVEPAEF
jgi:methylmalonyl-CoA mutase N-terminal domain/subunit